MSLATWRAAMVVIMGKLDGVTGVLRHVHSSTARLHLQIGA